MIFKQLNLNTFRVVTSYVYYCCVLLLCVGDKKKSTSRTEPKGKNNSSVLTCT